MRGYVEEHPGECVACLKKILVDRRGWCQSCRRRHACCYCERVTATVNNYGAACGECRRILKAQRQARMALERVSAEPYTIPVCRDPRRDVR